MLGQPVSGRKHEVPSLDRSRGCVRPEGTSAMENSVNTDIASVFVFPPLRTSQANIATAAMRIQTDELVVDPEGSIPVGQRASRTRRLKALSSQAARSVAKANCNGNDLGFRGKQCPRQRRYPTADGPSSSRTPGRRRPQLGVLTRATPSREPGALSSLHFHENTRNLNVLRISCGMTFEACFHVCRAASRAGKTHGADKSSEDNAESA